MKGFWLPQLHDVAKVLLCDYIPYRFPNKGNVTEDVFPTAKNSLGVTLGIGGVFSEDSHIQTAATCIRILSTYVRHTYSPHCTSLKRSFGFFPTGRFRAFICSKSYVLKLRAYDMANDRSGDDGV